MTITWHMDSPRLLAPNANCNHCYWLMGSIIIFYNGFLSLFCYGLHCVSSRFYMLRLNLSMWLFGDMAIKLKWDHKVRPWSNRTVVLTLFFECHVQRKGHVRIQKEGDFLQAQKRGLTKEWSCWYLNLRFPGSRTMRINFFYLSHPSLWYFIMATQVEQHITLSIWNGMCFHGF